MSGTEAVEKGSREELAGLRWQLDALTGELQKAQRALRREEALGRIRERIIGLRHLEEVPGKLEEVWVQELRALGIPIHRTSFQFPSARTGHFSSFWDAYLSEQRMDHGRLADYPWVAEVWASGQPVVVDRRRLSQTTMPPEIQSLVEVLLPNGGSLGVNSLQEEAFDEEAVQILQQVAGLVALGIERLRDLEVLRHAEESQRVELAVQRVRAEILQMEREADWMQVVAVFKRELQDLVPFTHCGINLLGHRRRATYGEEAEVFSFDQDTPLASALQQAMETGKPVYRRNREEMGQFGDVMGPEIGSVLDMPFAGGTVAINSTEGNAFSPRDIQLLERIAQVLSEGYRRLEDLQRLKAEYAKKQERYQLDLALQRVRNQVLQMAGEADWGQVVQVLDGQLRQTVDFYQLGVNLIDLQQGSARYYVMSEKGEYHEVEGNIHPVFRKVMEEGKSLYRPKRSDPLFSPTILPEVNSVVDEPFSGGTIAINSTREDAFSPRDIQILERFSQVMSEAYRRLEDLKSLQGERAQRQERYQLDLALQRVRNQVLQMKRTADWEMIVVSFWTELKELVEFDQCSIDLVDLQQERFFLLQVAEGKVVQTGWIHVLPRSLKEAVETGRPVYRRNRGEMERCGDTMETLADSHSVVDVPFLGGTFAINSTRVNAFSSRDLQVLEQFAQVLSEAHRRLEDLKSLALQEEQLHQAQKLEALGQLATGVAHEINNPLTSVLGYSELLLRRELAPEVREHLETIHQEGERARKIAARLLQFVRHQKAGTQLVSLNLLVEEVLALLRQQMELDHVQLSSALALDLPQVSGQPGQLQQLLLALLQNSREAIQKTGRAGAIQVQTVALEGRVRLVVEDDGPGIPEELKERIFEPFFTTKEVGKGVGSGMGLSLCYTIAREHGGRLWAEPGKTGACLVLELPASEGAGESIAKEGQRDAGR